MDKKESVIMKNTELQEDQESKQDKEHKKEKKLKKESTVELRSSSSRSKSKLNASSSKADVNRYESSLNIQKSISEFLHRYASERIDADEWTWESYSSSEGSEKDLTKVKKSRSKVKGRKSSSSVSLQKAAEKHTKSWRVKTALEDDKPKAATPNPETLTVADVVELIAKKKAEAEALAEAAMSETASVATSKKSKKVKPEKTLLQKLFESQTKGKKLSKGAKAVLMMQLVEKAKAMEEAEAKKAEEEARKRAIAIRKEGIEKEKREAAEQQIREEQLTNSLRQIRHIKKACRKKSLLEKTQNEWEEYLKCDGLPNPYDCGELNTYLYLWEQEMDETTIDKAAHRTKEALTLIDMLTTLIDDPMGIEQNLIESWKWIRCLYRRHQHKNLDAATYKILRNLVNTMNRSDLSTADFYRNEEMFSLYMFLNIKMPTNMPNPHEPPPPRLDIVIPEMQNIHVVFPESINTELQAVRVIYVKYDHFSDLCSSYHNPPIPSQYNLNFYEATLNEWNNKLFYKFERRPKPDKIQAKLEDELVNRQTGNIPLVPFQALEPSSSEYALFLDELTFSFVHESLPTTVEEEIVNLREYLIIGGVFYLNLFYQPPQPHDLVSIEMKITRLLLPKSITNVPVHIMYEPPSPVILESLINNTVDVEEIKNKKREEALDKLIFIQFSLPNHVLWLDTPLICQWDEQKNEWTTEDVHDVQYYGEENQISFKTGTFAAISLAVDRFLNMPFKSWEIIPQADGTILFSLKAAILEINFRIKDDLICIVDIANGALTEITETYFKLSKLMRILWEVGIDVFPAFDVFCYVEGACEKYWPMESHIYYNMAQLCCSYNFAWSRWNLACGRRSVVMQMREYKFSRSKQLSYDTVLLTPLRTAFINCFESSEDFCTDIVEGMSFYSDLYNLIIDRASVFVISKIQNTSKEQIGAIARLLEATKILSMC